MPSALAKKSRKLVKSMKTAELPETIRKLRASISEDTSLLQAAEKELSHRRALANRKKETEEFDNGD